MNMAVLTGTLVGVCVTLFFFQTVESIKCYQCGRLGEVISDAEPCDEPLDKEKFKASECPAGNDICVRTKVTNMMLRSCGIKSNQKLECTNDGIGEICLCNKNGCNGSGTIIPSLFAVGATAAFIAMYRFG